MNIDTQVDAVMQKIDSHQLAQSETDPADSIKFYRDIAQRCTDRADAIRDEHGVEEG